MNLPRLLPLASILIRGFDLSNMTIIEGDTGWIIVDPLTAREAASEAFVFAREHLGPCPEGPVLQSRGDSTLTLVGRILNVSRPVAWVSVASLALCICGDLVNHLARVSFWRRGRQEARS